MNGTLKDMFDERADALEPLRADVATIIATGRGRRRRRRAATGLAVLGLLVGVPVGWAALTPGDTPTPVTDGAAADVVWAEGSRVHLGGETVDVGRQVHSFVETSDGLVLTDSGSSVWSWREGRSVEVGRMRDDWRQRLVAGGRHAAWLDVSQVEWQFVILEQGTGTVLRVPVDVPSEVREGDPEPGTTAAYLRDFANVYAMDAGRVFAIDARGVIAIDVADGSVDVVAPPGGHVEVDDVQDGRILFSETADDGWGERMSYLSGGLDLDRPGAALAVDGGDLSPGLSWAMSENSATSADEFTLVDLDSGGVREVSASKDYDFLAGYAWLDSDSFAAYGVQVGDGAAPTVTLLSCEATSGTCRVEREGLRWGSVQLPTGEHLQD